MQKLSDETLKLLVNELYGCRNPHKLPKDSLLATKIIEIKGSLSHENLERFRDDLFKELGRRMSNYKKQVDECWKLLNSTI